MNQLPKPIGKILQPLGKIVAENALQPINRGYVVINQTKIKETPTQIVLLVVRDILEHISVSKQMFDTLVSELYNNLQPQPSVSFKFLCLQFQGRICASMHNQLSIDMRQFIRQKQNSLLSSHTGTTSYKYAIPQEGPGSSIRVEVTNFYIQIGDAQYLPFASKRLVSTSARHLNLPKNQQLFHLLNWQIYNASVDPLNIILFAVIMQLNSQAIVHYSGDPQMFELLDQVFHKSDYLQLFKYFIRDIQYSVPYGNTKGLVVLHLLNNKIIIGDQYIEVEYNFNTVVENLVSNVNILFQGQQCASNSLPRIYQDFYNRFCEETAGNHGEIEVCRINKDQLLSLHRSSETSNTSNQSTEAPHDEQQLDDVLQTLSCDYIVDNDTIVLTFDTKYYMERYLDQLGQLTALNDLFAFKDVLVAGEMTVVAGIRDACLRILEQPGMAKQVTLLK